MPTPSIEIISGDLLLRPFEPEDADAVYRACQDPLIQRWTGVPSPYERHHAESYTGGHGAALWEAGDAESFGVFGGGGHELLGSCGLVAINKIRNSAEIGYWTAPWARGRGVALAAIRAVATWAFEHRGLSMLTWVAEIGNHASRLAALRAGFRVSGEARLSQPRPTGRCECWAGTLLPGEVTREIPPAYAAGSPAVRHAKLFGAPQPSLDGLRPPHETDLDAIVRACQDADSARWTTVPVPYGRTDGEWFIRDHAPTTWARGSGVVYAIVDDEGSWAGSIELRLRPDDPEVAEVGYLVAPWARGRGYASRAVRTLVGWAFTELRLGRIVWRAHVGNEASRTVAERAGFVVEGVQRAGLVHRGVRIDAWVGALLPADARR